MLALIIGKCNVIIQLKLVLQLALLQRKTFHMPIMGKLVLKIIKQVKIASSFALEWTNEYLFQR